MIFLDVHIDDILERLERMKVNRIVGQNDGVTMNQILKFRQQFYEKWYDARMICERNESPESISDKILTYLNNCDVHQGYESTRGYQFRNKGFNEVLLQGLAPDGGLVVPRADPPFFTLGQLSRLTNLPYSERALRILEQWISSEEVRPQNLRSFISKAYTKDTFQHGTICPVRGLIGTRGLFVQELFHGPTASFKDLALQLMPRLFVNANTTSADNTR